MSVETRLDNQAEVAQPVASHDALLTGAPDDPVPTGALPQLGRDLFVTDGGLETTLIYHHGLDLPAFAVFDLKKDAAGAYDNCSGIRVSLAADRYVRAHECGYGRRVYDEPRLSVVGGCCGTDHRHVEAICKALSTSFAAA